MRYLMIAVLLAGCSHYVERTGAPAPVSTPQAAEQCKAQPDLDWCKQ